MGSVQFQIVPCSSLYFSSRSIGPFQCLVNGNYRVLICCTCHFQRGPLFFILASSACKSLQCLISTLTQGGRGTLQTNITGVCRECSQYIAHWVCPSSRRVCFPSLHCLGSTLLCQELSETDPGLYALHRSKPLRFRYSGSPQRRRLGWACVLCPSQAQAAQATRCLVNTFSPVGRCILSPPWSQLLGVLGAQWECCLRCAMCVLWGGDLWLWPS